MKNCQASKNFWQKLAKPIYTLAPMAGLTDSAFRQICKSFGADVVYSELASAEALVHDQKKTLAMLKFFKIERPYAVQLFGANPDHFAQAVEIVSREIKPDGIDINFGCPVKKVSRQGAGAVLMDDLKLARAVIAAAIKNTALPVSIKVRSRAGKIDVLKFLRSVKDLDIKAVMIHGRTLAQGHAGEVDWKIIKLARPLVKGVLLANGGVGDKRSAEKLLKLTGADGVGVGRGALGRPWVFKEVKSEKFKVKSKEEIFKIMLEHAGLAEKLKGKRGIIEMRKHLCWYAAGLPQAKKLRRELVKAESLNQIKLIIN